MRHISIATVLLAFLSGPFNSLAFAQAASLDKRYTVNLRPRSLDIRQRSIDEYRVLVERVSRWFPGCMDINLTLVGQQAIPSCGDASGNPVDVHNLVSSSG